MSSFACENIQLGQERFNDESWGRKRSICVWLLYCVINFCRFASPLISQWFADFELFASTGEELVWKYKESFDFTVEWFGSTNDAHSESLAASLLSFPTFFWNQQALVGNLLKILVDLFWPWLQDWWMHWKENNVRGEELDQYLDTSIRESQANEDIWQIKTFRNTCLLVLRQSQLRLENFCAYDRDKILTWKVISILKRWIYKSSQTQIDLFPFVTLMNDYKSK